MKKFIVNITNKNIFNFKLEKQFKRKKYSSHGNKNIKSRNKNNFLKKKYKRNKMVKKNILRKEL